MRRLVLVLMLVGLASVASARPGGGHSFSGGGGGHSFGGGSSHSFGSSHSSSSGSGGTGAMDPVGMLVAVAIGVILMIVVFAKKQTGWTSSGSLAYIPDEDDGDVPSGNVPTHGRQKLAALRQHDPDFSLVLFEDFLYALFARAHEARGKGQLDTLVPWLRPTVRYGLAAGGATNVEGVVIGAMTIRDAVVAPEDEPGSVRALVGFEANYTETVAGEAQTYYVVEKWRVRRALAAKSRPPETLRDFQCPSCGAALDQVTSNVCSFCKQTLDTGQLDWVVFDREVEARARRGPQLTSDVEEEGTDLPLKEDASAQSRLRDLIARDPAFALASFTDRVRLIFGELQVSWSARDLGPVRGFVSDGIFQSWSYWIAAYRRQKLRNQTVGSNVNAVELARVTSDRWYDGITVRVSAAGPEYTVNDAEVVVSGSPDVVREYAEYWTFIRGSGVRGAARVDKLCPNCGVALTINMAGNCGSCQAKVTAGQFDWVLSRIEQDETYQAE